MTNMSWFSILQMVLTIFGPSLSDFVKRLIDKWFARAEVKLKTAGDPGDMPPNEAIDLFFKEMKAALPKIAPARQLLVALMHRMTLARATEIMGNFTPLSEQEALEFSYAHALTKKE